MQSQRMSYFVGFKNISLKDVLKEIYKLIDALVLFPWFFEYIVEPMYPKNEANMEIVM